LALPIRQTLRDDVRIFKQHNRLRAATPNQPGTHIGQNWSAKTCAASDTNMVIGKVAADYPVKNWLIRRGHTEFDRSGFGCDAACLVAAT
jgi:hypothetical protein